MNKKPWFEICSSGIRALALECGAHSWLRQRAARAPRTRAVSAAAVPTPVRRWCSHPLFERLLLRRIDGYVAEPYLLPLELDGAAVAMDSRHERLYAILQENIEFARGRDTMLIGFDLRRRCVLFKICCSNTVISLAVNSRDGFVYVLDYLRVTMHHGQTGRVLNTVGVRAVALVWHNTLHQLFATVASRGIYAYDANLTPLNWFVETGVVLGNMAVGADRGRLLFVHDANASTVVIYCGETGRCLSRRRFRVFEWGTQLAFHAPSKSLLALCRNTLWRMTTGPVLLRISAPFSAATQVDAVCVDDITGAVICCCHDSEHCFVQVLRDRDLTEASKP